MEIKLVIAKSISLLYKESCVPNYTSNSADLVKHVLETIKIPDIAMEQDRSRDVLVGLRSTLMWMTDNPMGYIYDKSSFHQRIRINAADDSVIYNAIMDVLNEDHSNIDQLKKSILNYRETIRDYVKQEKIKEILQQESRKANFDSHSVDWKVFVQEVMAKLEVYNVNGDSREQNGVVADIDFSNIAAIKETMQSAQIELSSEGSLKTGWQSFNRMLGEAGGFRRGEMVVIPALQHNFKSGMMLSLMRQIAMHNKPVMRDPTKKPMLMRISFENEATSDIMWLYKNLKELETGQYCDITTCDIQEASEYLSRNMEINGFHINVVRIDPSNYTFNDLFDRIAYFESEGYEIHALFCDYLNMMSKRGCMVGGAMGMDIRDLFRRVRNYMSPRGITFITPHQLSTEAKQLVRNGVDNFVQEIANKGYYDSCRTIDQEVDLEIYIHIEKRGIESYLTFQRGKHRKVSITPLQDLYFVLKFHAIGTLHDDINGRDSSMKRVGGASVADGGAPAWFDLKAA